MASSTMDASTVLASGSHPNQQPLWTDEDTLQPVRDRLALRPALVTTNELWRLRGQIAGVARGEALLLQAGDCAESLHECTPAHVRDKIATLSSLAEHLAKRSGLSVTSVGRIGGQFAKPRSRGMEWYGGRELPAFRGHLINSELPTPQARRPDPDRMLLAYQASSTVLRLLAEYRDTGGGLGPWSSHEALVMDYEASLLRADAGTSERFLASTHLPWVGERTRQPGSVQLTLLASVTNPVGCKIGPSATEDEVVRVCGLLDPDRVPGRLVLIIRLGHRLVWELLPPIVRAVRAAGHPVAWLSDPMHGNTFRTRDGRKTRNLADITSEALAARDVLRDLGEHPGGLHIEVAAAAVTECVGGDVLNEDALRARYTSLCDPRLNPAQALELLDAWA